MVLCDKCQYLPKRANFWLVICRFVYGPYTLAEAASILPSDTFSIPKKAFQSSDSRLSVGKYMKNKLLFSVLIIRELALSE